MLKNVHLKDGGAADGIHCKGNCTLENVVWDGVCEDAATMEGGAGKTMTVNGGSANNAEDKVFQHNGHGSTVKLNNFTTYGYIGRLWASCGDCVDNAGPRYLVATGVTIAGTVEDRIAISKGKTPNPYVIRLNSNYGDKATVRSMKIKNYSAGNPKICVQATGITKAQEDAGAKQTNQGEFWNTQYCDISHSDVTSF